MCCNNADSVQESRFPLYSVLFSSLPSVWTFFLFIFLSFLCFLSLVFSLPSLLSSFNPSVFSFLPFFPPYILMISARLFCTAIHRFEKIKEIGIIKMLRYELIFLCMWRNYKPIHIRVERKDKAECIRVCVIWRWLLAKILSGAAASDTHHLSLIIRTKLKLP